jgi:hypothetical protein
VTVYHLYRNSTEIATLNGSTLTYTDNGLTSGTTYLYAVSAGDAANHGSNISNILSVSTPSGTSPANNPQMLVYRLYNSSTNNHFYTISVDEVNAILGQGYRFEGYSHIAYANPGSGLVPVYRLYSPSARYHFYTTSVPEAQAVINIGYKWEGIGFYAYDAPATGRVAVYRLLFPATGKHFWSTNLAETNALISQGWRFEGTGWWGL